jgi:hypothetical protein
MKIDLSLLKEKWDCMSSYGGFSYLKEWVYGVVMLKSNKDLKEFVDAYGGLDNCVKMMKEVKGDIRDLYVECSVFLIVNYIKDCDI